MMSGTEIKKCYSCGGKKLKKILSLGHHAPSDAFLTAKLLDEVETTYPLDLMFCKNCFLVQLGYAVNPAILFSKDFIYRTGMNNHLKQNFASLAANLIKRFKLKRGDLAIDIGSNDGTLLENYIPFGLKIIGVDPSAAAQFAKKKGIPTMVDFFNEETAKKIEKKYGKAAVITSTNTFAHIHELQSTMRGINLLLRDKGVFVAESHYLLDMIEKNQYDWIYHEHLRHYSLKPLVELFNRHGLEIFDAERVRRGHGGSIRTFAAKTGAYAVTDNLKTLIDKEISAGLYRSRTFEIFAGKVKKNKFDLLGLILKIRKTGGRIVGIGAPAKGSTILNYCRLDPNLIDYITEKSPLKMGKFTPGSHIPIVNEEKLFKDQPEFALLLSWNLAREIVPKLRKGGFRGKFIIPNPTPHIV